MRHPAYNMDLFDADLALLHLASSVTLTERIRPICLPRETTSISSSATVGIVIGFGFQNEPGELADTLQEAYVPLISNEACKKAWQQYSYQVTDNMICAGFESGKQYFTLIMLM